MEFINPVERREKAKNADALLKALVKKNIISLGEIEAEKVKK